MRDRLMVATLILAVAGAGCGVVAEFGDARPYGRATPGAGGGFLLLGAKEGKDIDEADAPPIRKVKGKGKPSAAEAKGGFVLRVGGGLALPGTGAIGSAPGSTVPGYADVWTEGTAIDVVGEFGAGKKITAYAQFSLSQFSGQRWTNPADADDSWLASDTGLAFVAGGARFGGTFYAKAAAGLLLWPEVSRVAYVSGYDEPILASGVTVAFAAGGGAEFKLGKLKAYVDAEYMLGTAPAKAENAVIFWPNFKAAETSSFKLAGGVAFSF